MKYPIRKIIYRYMFNWDYDLPDKHKKHYRKLKKKFRSLVRTKLKNESYE